LVIKSGDLKEKFLKIANFARLPSQIHHQTYLYMIFSGQKIGENSLAKETLVETGNPFVQISVMMISLELV
jgi:hypothetical protein